MSYDPSRYQQQPYGHQPRPVQAASPGHGVPLGPPQPPRKSSPLKILLVTAACTAGVFLFIAGIVNFIGKADPGAGSRTEAGAPKAAGMNTPVRDGKFEFTVTNLECDKESVGSGLFKSTAQGSYCLITVKVRNIGKEAQSFSGSEQKALDAKNTEYSNDGSAEFNVNSGTPTWAEDVNPGNQITGILVFDVPAGTKLTRIELHDSFLSRGVKVTLK